MQDAADTRATARQKEIFLAALEISDADECSRFLDTACGDDARLRARIERLLRLEAGSRDFLETTRPMPIRPDFTLPRPGESVGCFGDYVLLDEIARGSSGVVFRARQSSLNRVVALKMLRDRPLLTSEAEARRFRAEAEAAASLEHANIVPIYEVGVHEGQAYFSMKLVEGGTLQSRAAEFSDPEKAVGLMITVARAVQYAHERGLLHRDLKPGNILLDAADEPHITDFGIAKKLGIDSSLTVSGQVMGTPHYMAPEQARAENRHLTPATDVYSLGAMLYELLGGRRPFAADDLVGLLHQVNDSTPPSLRSLRPSMDRDLDTVVMRCLEKSPSDRYASAAEFADDLGRWLRGEPLVARPAGPLRRLLKWTKRRPVHAAAASLGVLLGATLAVGAWLWSRLPPSPASLVPPSFFEAWSWGGNRYQIIQGDGISWDDAASRAEKLGGHLVAVTSTAESAMLCERAGAPLRGGVAPQVWVGAKSDPGQDTWQWITGETFEPLSGIAPPKSSAALSWLSLTAGGPGHSMQWLELDDRLLRQDPAGMVRGFCVEWENAAPPAPLPGAGADGWVDLLAGLELSTLNLSGEWKRTPEGLICPDGEASFIEFRCPLPEEFDYEVEFTAAKGSNLDVSQYFPTPVPDHPIMLRHVHGGINLGPILDGGLATGRYPDDDWEGRSAVRNREWKAVAGERCRCRVEVRQAAIRVLFNEEAVLQWSGDFRRLSPLGWRSAEDPRNPCLMANCRDVTFHSVKVRTASGLSIAGSFVRRRPMGEPGSHSHTLTSSDWRWQGPVNAGPAVNSAAYENQPSLTADGLELFFHRAGSSEKLWCARRSRVDLPFKQAEPVAELSRPTGWEASPSISPDGLTLWYAQSLANPQFDLAVVRRRDRLSPWETPVPLSLSPAPSNNCPSLSADGLTLVFCSGEPSAIHVSRRASPAEPFTSPQKVTGAIESTLNDYSPFLCADGRTLLFSRRIPPDKSIIHITVLNGAVTTGLARLDLPGVSQDGPWLSADGLTLYLSCLHPGSRGLTDIWSFRRVKVAGAGSRGR